MARRQPSKPIPPGLPPPEWKDASGRLLARGQYIGYAVGQRSAGAFRFGMVTSLVTKVNQRFEYFNPPPPAGQWPRGQYVDYLQPKIKVISARSGDAIYKATLEDMRKVLILTEDQIPPKELEALKKAWTGDNGE